MRTLTFLTAALLAIALAGCGRKAEPTPPGPPSQVIFPKSFPKKP